MTERYRSIVFCLLLASSLSALALKEQGDDPVGLPDPPPVDSPPPSTPPLLSQTKASQPRNVPRLLVIVG